MTTNEVLQANQPFVSNIITATLKIRVASIKIRDQIRKKQHVKNNTLQEYITAVNNYNEAHRAIDDSDVPFNKPLENMWNLLSVSANQIIPVLQQQNYDILDMKELATFITETEQYSRRYYHDLGYRMPQAA